MAATLTANIASLILKVDDPGRDDLTSINVWASTTSGFTPNTSNLVFSGKSFTILIPNLTPLVTYYVKYAYISEIDPTDYDVSAQLSGIPNKIDGDLVVDGTLSANKLKTGTLSVGTTITVGTPATANGGIEIVGGATAGQDYIVQKVNGSDAVRMGYLGTAVNGSTFGFQTKSTTGSVLFDSRNNIGIVGNTTHDNYNVGDSTTNPYWNTNSNGINNLSIGAYALNYAGNIGRSYNISIGLNSLRSLDTGFENVAIGRDAARYSTGSYRSVYLGTYAGLNGSYDAVAIGTRSLSRTSAKESEQGGLLSVAVGYHSGSNITTGAYNTYVGAYCAGSEFLEPIGTGGNNSGFGSNSLFSISSGFYNTAVGDSSGNNLTSGYNNTLVGAISGSSLTTGSGNTFIGYSADADSDVSDNVIISNGTEKVLHYDGSNWYTNNKGISAGLSAATDSQFTANGYSAGTTQYGFNVNTTSVSATNAFYAYNATGIPNASVDSLVAAYRSDYDIRSGPAVNLIKSHRTSNVVHLIVDSWPSRSNNGLLPGLYVTSTNTTIGLNSTYVILSASTNVLSTLTPLITTSTTSTTIIFSVATTLNAGTRIYDSTNTLIGELASTISSSTTGTLLANATKDLSAASAKYTYCAVSFYSVGPDIALAPDSGTVKAYTNTLNFYNPSSGTAHNFFDSTTAINADLNITGTFRVAGNIYTSGAVTNQDGGIIGMYPGTSDGYDSAYAYISGGGATSNTRGAYIVAYGNEAVTYPGRIRLVPGITTSTSSAITLEGVTKISGTVFNSNTYSTTTTLTYSNDIVFISASAAWNLTLPSPLAGKKIDIIRTDSTAFIISVIGHINGVDATTNTSWFPASTPDRRLTLVSNGSTWYVLQSGAYS